MLYFTERLFVLHMKDLIKSLNLRYIKANGKDKQEISMIKILMIREISKIDIGQIVEIEHHIEVEVSVDKN